MLVTDKLHHIFPVILKSRGLCGISGTGQKQWISQCHLVPILKTSFVWTFLVPLFTAQIILRLELPQLGPWTHTTTSCSGTPKIIPLKQPSVQPMGTAIVGSGYVEPDLLGVILLSIYLESCPKFWFVWFK